MLEIANLPYHFEVRILRIVRDIKIFYRRCPFEKQGDLRIKNGIESIHSDF